MAGVPKAYRRLNITLPEKTVELVDQVAPRGDRSRVIAEAIRHYVTKARRTELKRRLKEGAVQRAERDKLPVAEWSDLDRPTRRRACP
jgi:CopG family transcriptional regulator/antitoxin EndoAI